MIYVEVCGVKIDIPLQVLCCFRQVATFLIGDSEVIESICKVWARLNGKLVVTYGLWVLRRLQAKVSQSLISEIVAWICLQ